MESSSIESSPDERQHNVFSLDARRRRKQAEKEGKFPQKEVVAQMLNAMLYDTLSGEKLTEELWMLSIKKALPLIWNLKKNNDTITAKAAELETMKKDNASLRSEIIETLYTLNEDDEEEEK